MDDQVYPPMHILRRHPLLSTVICSVAARAIKPELYLFLLSEADNLIKDSFQGPTPDFYSLIAMILVTAWCGRFRLWCYVISVASELKLNEAALQLGENDMQNTEEVMERARTWFTLCCFDLQLNLTRPFAMTRLKDYLPYAKALLTSPYCRPVDYRICALIEGFTIADSVKSQLRSSQLQAQPLSRAVCQLLTSFDDRTDEWFHKINNKIEPLYQTFGEQQDRNRFMIPYAYLKLYINGLAFHGLESAASNAPDASRLAFIRKALDSASLLIQTQFESDMFQAKLRYTIDYNGTTLIHASNFILKVIPLVYQHLDCQKYLASLRKAAQMFEQAGAQEAANEMRWEQENLLELTQTELSPEAYDDGIDATMEETEGLFDIPNFLNDMTWASDFPILSDYTLS
ncbi:hypothetical protein GQ53DRAFT_528128 [Thozetella sp. PMI_491]|nr:hypothetical protein GQ53DRAFT_528128 [Thozetella sp. PMI_491]